MGAEEILTREKLTEVVSFCSESMNLSSSPPEVLLLLHMLLLSHAKGPSVTASPSGQTGIL